MGTRAGVGLDGNVSSLSLLSLMSGIFDGSERVGHDLVAAGTTGSRE
jgi:hypothetical protein